MKSLAEIYNKYKLEMTPGGQDGDKGTAHSYISHYETILEPFRFTKGNILEIGVSAGLSIRMWEEYFPKAKIFGLDSNISLNQYLDHKAVLIEGDSTWSDAADRMKEMVGDIKFTIIIDDGSHVPEDQVKTLNNFYPLLKVNGLYVIEDVNGISMVEKAVFSLKRKSFKTNDFRRLKGRHDDVLIEVYK